MSRIDMPAHAAGPMRADARRNRERLVVAALDAFTERGTDDTSLEGIARRAGVGIGTLYRHFPTRQALLESVYRDQVDALCAQARALLSEPSPVAALTAWMRALVGFSLTKRTLTAGLLAGTGGVDPPVFSACRTEILAAADALLTRAQQEGQVRPDLTPTDVLRLSHAVVAATGRSADREAESGRLLEIMLGGILLPAGS